jgi:hypothetical protein
MISSLPLRNQNIFSSTALNAKSEADLNLAGYYFSNAVAKIGVTVVIAMIAHTAAKGVNAKLKATAAQRKATTARENPKKLRPSRFLNLEFQSYFTAFLPQPHPPQRSNRQDARDCDRPSDGDVVPSNHKMQCDQPERFGNGHKQQEFIR